jgi:hypothetical protein
MEWLKKVLTDERNSPSSKRLIAMVGSSAMFITLFINSFSEVGYAPSPELITGCVTIICVCLGASTVDKFSTKV